MSRRVNTQPLCPAAFRTRLQSSMGTGGGSLAGPGVDLSFDSSIQSGGGFGAGGIGGGGTTSLALFDFLVRVGAACGAGLGGAGPTRGATRRPMTSTFSPSFTTRKLGD